MKISKEKFEIELAQSEYLISDIVNLTGLTRVSVANAVNGSVSTRPQTIGKIAKALGVAVEAIIVKEGE